MKRHIFFIVWLMIIGWTSTQSFGQGNNMYPKITLNEWFQGLHLDAGKYIFSFNVKAPAGFSLFVRDPLTGKILSELPLNTQDFQIVKIHTTIVAPGMYQSGMRTDGASGVTSINTPSMSVTDTAKQTDDMEQDIEQSSVHNAIGSAIYYNGVEGLRVLIVGNSITRCQAQPHIGWYDDWGMAASAKEKDYVHILMSKFRAKYGKVRFCVAQLVEEVERNYKDIDAALASAKFDELKNFQADIVIFRLSENVRTTNEAEQVAFKAAYEKTVRFLSRKDGKTQLIFSTGFWNNPKVDAVIRSVAKAHDAPCVELGDLDNDTYKATGLFEHDGVAAHPGDLGMQVIAERLFDAVKENAAIVWPACLNDFEVLRR